MNLLTHRSFDGTSWRAAAAVALMAGVLGLSACGGSDSDADAGGNSTPAGSGSPAGSDSKQDRAQVRLDECLREQGIDPPDADHGGGGGPPENQQQLQDALEGPCKKFQTDAFGNASEEEQSDFQDRLTKFTSCMRKNGVDIPDFEHGSGAPPEIDQDDPATRKAFEACQDELPQFGPGGPGQ